MGIRKWGPKEENNVPRREKRWEEESERDREI